MLRQRASRLLAVPVSNRYSTAAVGKRVRSTILYHSRECGIVLKTMLRSHKLHCRLHYDAQLQPKVVKTVYEWSASRVWIQSRLILSTVLIINQTTVYRVRQN